MFFTPDQAMGKKKHIGVYCSGWWWRWCGVGSFSTDRSHQAGHVLSLYCRLLQLIYICERSTNQRVQFSVLFLVFSFFFCYPDGVHEEECDKLKQLLPSLTFQFPKGVINKYLPYRDGSGPVAEKINQTTYEINTKFNWRKCFFLCPFVYIKSFSYFSASCAVICCLPLISSECQFKLSYHFLSITLLIVNNH